MAGFDTTLRWIAFRATAAYVTDGATTTHWTEDAVGATIYGNVNNPGLAVNGTTYTAGWVLGGGATSFDQRNRTTSGDVRLAGCHSIAQNSAVFMDFEIDGMPTGLIEIHIADGDTYTRTKQYVAVYDNTTLLSTLIDSSGGVAADHFFDAGANDRTRAAWPGAEVGVQVTLSTTTLKIRVGKAANSSDAAALAALGIKVIASAVDPGVITGSASLIGLPGLILS